MSLTFKSLATLEPDNTVKCRVRQHTVTFEGLSLGNSQESTVMNPIEGILSAIGACQLIVARLYAEQNNINFSDLRIELEGELPEGSCTDVNLKPRFESIKTKFFIKTDSPKDKVEKFMEFVENNCPVANLVKNSNQVFPDVILEQV